MVGGQDYQHHRDHQDSVKATRRFPQYITFLLILLVIVLTNVVIHYSFTSNCRCGESSLNPFKLSSSNERLMMAKLLNSSRQAEEVLEKELESLRAELKALQAGTERIIQDRTQLIWDELMARPLSCPNGGGGDGKGGVQFAKDVDLDTNPWANWAVGDLPQELQRFVGIRNLPLGWSPTLHRETVLSPVGHGCALLKDDVEKYMSYEIGKECPDDEALTQKLLVGGCEPLPRRRCFVRIPKNYTEPFPLPDAYWKAPGDDKVIWTAHTCKGFDCLRNRVKGKVFADCLDCFDLEGRERKRWVALGGDLDFTVQEVVALKNGTIRIGLDLGGGTGTFAVRMKEHDVTIVTTTLNLNGPFNNFVALRGVIPIYMTVSQRLPFFDNTLDLVHSMHVLSNWIPTESLEFILYDIDRILRPGGIFWLDHFFCIRSQLATYEPLIEQLGYTKLKYVVGDKVDRGRELQEVYISALLEKPLRRFSISEEYGNIS
ncbi:unnamed protein product [Calypogeia fissa]